VPYYIVMCGLPVFTIFFPALSRKRRNFREKAFDHKTCVLILCTTAVWNIAHYKKISARFYQKVNGYSYKKLKQSYYTPGEALRVPGR